MSYADWMEHHSGEFSRGNKPPEGSPTMVTVNGMSFQLDKPFEVDSYAVTMGLCRPFYQGSIPQVSCFGRNFLVAAYLDSQGANLETCVSGLLAGCSYAYLGVDEHAAVMYEVPGVAECVGYTELLIEDIMIATLGLEVHAIDSMLVKYSSECVTKFVFTRFALTLLQAVDFSNVVDVKWDEILKLDQEVDMMDPFRYKLSSIAMLYFAHLSNDLDCQLKPIEFFTKMKLMMIDYLHGEDQWAG